MQRGGQPKRTIPLPCACVIYGMARLWQAFPYRLERYTTASSAAPAAAPAKNDSAAVACDQHREMTTRLNCSMCFVSVFCLFGVAARLQTGCNTTTLQTGMNCCVSRLGVSHLVCCKCSRSDITM